MQDDLGLSEEEKALLARLSERLSMAEDAKYQVSQTEEVEALQPTQERKRSVEELALDVVKLIKTSSVIEFGCMGIGNVFGVPRGETNGARGYLFRAQFKNFAEDQSMRYLDGALSMDGDIRYEKRWHHFPQDGKICVICRIPFGGREGNPYVTDGRGGVHLTLALRFKKQELLNMEDKEIVEEFMKEGMGFYDRVLDACAREFIPGYYQNLKNLATKAGRKL